ncbi:uncharacterized protein LOC111197186 [Astyanax mexicanus]|uniref:uncharacterized protein LOC111197186 n=1 Tax=Astyanax mexicanus TaxID=7994 RepID=UPI0020CB10BE|nr:uncharacterized protein LOC111197186 [Astyanax mexicanus]
MFVFYRCLLGETTGPAQWPDDRRVVEAVCRQLCDLYPSSVQTKGVRVERWALILQDYHSIRQLVLNAPTLMSRTTLQLFEINRRTLMQWFNKRQKAQERAVLLQGVERPSASAVAQDPLPLPREQPLQPPTFAFQPFTFASPPNTAGQAVRRRQKTEMPQPPQAPGARLILPAASASQTQPVCIFISPPTSSHIPVPAFQPVQHTVQPPTAVTGAAAAAQVERVPATTAWYRKKTEDTQRRKYERSSEANLCSKCGQPKQKEFGHSRFGSETFCAANSSLTVDQWLAQMRLKHKK